jgi:SAM-dependent methyltransferase
MIWRLPRQGEVVTTLRLDAYRLQYTLRRYFVDRFMACIAAQLPPRSRVLDLGGHKAAKRGEFDISRYNLQVLYANLTADKLPDVQSDAAALPFPSAGFDVVICAELLEHVPEPRRVVFEAARVLCPGGTLVITAPFLYPIHADPYDFGRYTDTYWRHVLSEAGFVVVRIEAQGLLFAIVAGLIKQTVDQVRVPGTIGRLVRGAATVAFVAPVQAAAVALEQIPWVRGLPYIRAYTTGFGVVARRAEAICVGV